MAELLNISSEDHRALYLDENPNNSYQTAINNADAVWCTDWDNWKADEINEMLLHGYGQLSTKDGPNKGHASAISIINHDHDEFFNKDGLRTIRNETTGCTGRILRQAYSISMVELAKSSSPSQSRKLEIFIAAPCFLEIY